MDMHGDEDLLGTFDYFGFTALNGGPTQPFSHRIWGARNRAYLSSVNCSVSGDLPAIHKSLKITRQSLKPDDQTVCTPCTLSSSTTGRNTSRSPSPERKRAMPRTTIFVHAFWAQR